MTTKYFRAAATVAAVMLGCALGWSQTTYTVTDLGTLGGTVSYGFGINKSGQVTGYSYTAGDNDYHAFLYSGGTMTDLGTLGGSLSQGNGINASGQVVGWSWRANSGFAFAFLYSNGAMTDLGTLGGLNANGINTSGQVTGATTNNHAFLYSGGTMTDLGTLPGDSLSQGLAINDSGQVTGWSAGGNTEHAFLYSGGTMTGLGTLGGSVTVGQGINASGQVVGYSSITNDAAGHAFLYSGGTMTDLGTLGGTNSQGNGINASGQVVGGSATAGNASHAFLYSNGTMSDLNNLIPSNSGWVLYTATAINDNGQITGFGALSSGGRHAFLLTPNNTQSGTGVVVQPTNTTASGTPVTLTFSTVTQGGSTTLTTSTSGPPPPSGFKLGQPPVYYNLSTTALYSGPITICINYAGISFTNPNNIAIWHYDTNTASWTQLATTVNTATTTACASTPSLSPFALFEPVYVAYVQQPINADGSSVFSANRGVVPVKFTLTLNGTATCTLPQATISLGRISGGTSTSIDESTYSISADSGSYYRIDTTNCQYVYNLASSSLGTGTYQVNISINGAVVGSGIFGLQ